MTRQDKTRTPADAKPRESVTPWSTLHARTTADYARRATVALVADAVATSTRDNAITAALRAAVER